MIIIHACHIHFCVHLLIVMYIYFIFFHSAAMKRPTKTPPIESKLMCVHVTC